MKHLIKVSIAILAMTATLSSCRDAEDEKTETEMEVEQMIDDADKVEVKDDKIKVESPDGSETKIKYDENGEIEKVKTDDNS